jgi:hypothetical protein
LVCALCASLRLVRPCCASSARRASCIFMAAALRASSGARLEELGGGWFGCPCVSASPWRSYPQSGATAVTPVAVTAPDCVTSLIACY